MKLTLFYVNNILVIILLGLFLTSCKKNDADASTIPKEEFKPSIPLPFENFQDVAVQYKDALDLGQRGNLVGLTEKNSRNILIHTINFEHMIYFAAVNGINTSKLILILRTENPKTSPRSSEIEWINNRWKFESDCLLNGKFTRPKIPLVKELLNVKVTMKKNNEYDYNVYFSDTKIDVAKYNIDSSYIPFYWEYDAETKTIYIPEILIHVVQVAGFARVDLTKSYIMRGKKPINILDHPLFLWKGEVPAWAEQTMRNEKYFYAHRQKEPKKTK